MIFCAQAIFNFDCINRVSGVESTPSRPPLHSSTLLWKCATSVFPFCMEFAFEEAAVSCAGDAVKYGMITTLPAVSVRFADSIESIDCIR